MSAPNRAPSSIWTLRRGNFAGWVTTGPDDTVEIYSMTSPIPVMRISRSDARLLARRINQCLDETRKR